MLEKDEICQGASSRNTGAIHLSGKDPADKILAEESIRILKDLHEELDQDFEYECTGSICLIQREEDLERRLGIMKRDQEYGIDVTFLQPEEVVRLAIPYLDPKFASDFWRRILEQE